ncbi:hypothetical protein QTP70_018981 [Hemibagrus guttatus]|uniref:Uncharacterized protein n=1 Tax=Hemibagrus guttatus TaxID=175788 RepID=A0AAE0PQV3_9TELE|nr:hypothetical protein QTP70_018981 [Hemibagrus guttatus]KAK3525095.1 hypothetical protein QTP86_015272 [Hemibagrus guttatus]
MLIPAYRPLVRHSKPVLKQVKTWPSGATSALQDCFECTDWNMFREAATNGNSINMEEYTTSVTRYISKCIDYMTISKTITTCSNQKLWMTLKVHALLKLRVSAFRAGDKTALKQQGLNCIPAITNYKTTSPACDSDAYLPNTLNDFYTVRGTELCSNEEDHPNDQALCLSMADVKRTLCRVNPEKFAGPDNIPGRVFRECAEQLADVFTDIQHLPKQR